MKYQKFEVTAKLKPAEKWIASSKYSWPALGKQPGYKVVREMEAKDEAALSYYVNNFTDFEVVSIRKV